MIDELMAQGSKAFSASRFSDAIRAYTAAIESAGNEKAVAARAHSNRSAAHACLQQYAEALADAKRCVEIDPTFLKGHGRVGAALQGLKRYEEAAAAYRHGLQLDPSNSAYRSAVAELDSLIASGRGVASEATRNAYYLEQSLKKAKLAMEQNEPHEAVRYYTKALALCEPSDRPVLLTNRSAAHYNDSDYTSALADAQAATAAAPSYARAHLRVAMAMQKLTRLDEAIASAQCAASLNASCEKSRQLIASITAEQDAHAKAQTDVVDPAPPAHGVQAAKAPEAPAPRAAGGLSYRHSYSYCTYCNKHGHARAQCPLRGLK